MYSPSAPVTWPAPLNLLPSLHTYHSPLLSLPLPTLTHYVRFSPPQVLSTQTNFAHTMVGTPYYLSPELCEDKVLTHFNYVIIYDAIGYR